MLFRSGRRAKTVCPELRAQVQRTAMKEFAPDTTITPELLDLAALAEVWADAVNTAAKAQLTSRPESIVGWRLKPGRTMKKWKDSKMAAAALQGHPEAFELKSVSAIEKLGFEFPAGIVEVSSAAASLAKVK